MATKDTVLQSLSVLADLYTKSKAVDLAESQFMIQRESAIADRQLQERQLDIAENKALSTEKLAELQVNMSILNDLKSEKRSQEQAYTKAYGVSPIYKTSAMDEIGSIMQGDLDNKIQGVGVFINTLGNQLDELSIMRGALQAEETYFAEEYGKYSGLNKVLEDHEFETLITDAKQLTQFEDSEGIGFRAAFNKQGTPLRRQAMAYDMTNKMKKESSDLATIQYSTMQAMTNKNEDFDWEANFGSKEMAEAAKEALASSDYKYFLSHINMPGNEAIRDIFRSHKGLRGQLSNIEGNAQRVYALDAEFAGEKYTPGGPVGSFVKEYEAIVSTADLGQGNKAAMFDAYKNFVSNKGITDRATLDQMFSILEDKYGQDLGLDFERWMDDPDAFASPDGQPPAPFKPEVGSLDALIQEFDKTTSDKAKIKTEQKAVESWDRDVSGDFNRFYQLAPSSLQSLLDGIYKKSPELIYGHGGEIDATQGSDLTTEQWAELDDKVAQTVSMMLENPVLPAFEGIGKSIADVGLLGIKTVGGTLLSSAPGLSEMEGPSRDLLKTGRNQAKKLLDSYSEYKSKVQSQPSFSDEVKQLMKEYNLDDPSEFTTPKGSKSSTLNSPIGSTLDSQEKEKRLDDLIRMSKGFESANEKNKGYYNSSAFLEKYMLDQISLNDDMTQIDEDFNSELTSLDALIKMEDKYDNEFLPIDSSIVEMEWGDRNPFLLGEE